MEIFIRPLNTKDKKQLQDLFKKTVHSEFPEYSAGLKHYYSSGKYFERMMALPITFGAFEKEQLIGFIIAEDAFGGIVFAHWLTIMREYQKKGIGKKLVRTLEEEAIQRGAHGIYLEADIRNVPFYESLGYSILGHDEHGYFGLDEYFMKKLLQNPIEEAYLKR